MGSKRDSILLALENLTHEELKKFKLKLGAVRLPEGFRNIPRGSLGQMDAVDLTDKLVNYYCEDFAAKLTIQLLREMGMSQLAAELQEAV